MWSLLKGKHWDLGKHTKAAYTLKWDILLLLIAKEGENLKLKQEKRKNVIDFAIE